MSAHRPITMPHTPWDGAMTRPVAPVAAIQPEPAYEPVAIPDAPPMCTLVRQVFDGQVSLKDLPFMASALIQLSDENYEMRQRIIALELAVKAMGAK